MALGLFLDGTVADDPVAASSPEAQEFSQESSAPMDYRHRGIGTAGPEDIAAAVEASLAQFAPDARDPADQNGQT